jgi:hypothetical protein
MGTILFAIRELRKDFLLVTLIIKGFFKKLSIKTILHPDKQISLY